MKIVGSLFSFLVLLGATVVAQERELTPFDSFGDIRSSDTGARLHNFAFALQERSDHVGYIVMYGPGGKSPGPANNRLEIFRNYVLNFRAFDTSQLQIVYAGTYKDPREFFTELWLVPVGNVLPELKKYDGKQKVWSGKFEEVEESEFEGEGGCGPYIHGKTVALVADVLRNQPKDVTYVVAFSYRGSVFRNWRRIAERQVELLTRDGIEADRIKIIYGGSLKPEEEYQLQTAKLQYWIQSPDAAPPMKEGKVEPRAKEAEMMSSHYDSEFIDSATEPGILRNIIDVLQADQRLSIAFIVRTTIPHGSDRDPIADTPKLAERWKAELSKKFGSNRIVILNAGGTEYGAVLEIWAVPPGQKLPDPNPPDEIDEEPAEEIPPNGLAQKFSSSKSRDEK